MKKESENELPKIRVVLRNEFVNLQGEARLNYFVRFRGKTIKKPSGLYINPKYWNSKKMDVLGTTREVQRIRAILDEKKADFNSYFLKIDASGGKITKGTIDDFFDNKQYNDFIDFYLSYVKQHTEYGKSTVSKYKRTIEVLQVFCKDRGLKTLRFNDINLPFLIDFDRYLIYKLKISSDSADNYHKNIKTVLTRAVVEDIIIKSPYANGFRPIKTKNKFQIIPLSDEEIKSFENIKLSIEQSHLQRFKDIFVFMLNTGLRFSDVAKLKHTDIQDRAIKLIQHKTERPVFIPLNTKAIGLINKYKAINKEDSLDFVFPVSCNQVFNRRLKDLADLADISKNLHCHLSRHSFATCLIRKNVSLENVSALMGHSDIKMTRRYAKGDVRKLYEAVDLL